MGGGGVHVEVTLLHVLAVIGLGPAHSKQPLFQYGVASVPQRDAEAHASLAVAKTEQTIFAPPVGAAARVVVWEIRPARSVGGIVFTHRSPLPLGKVGSPALPVLLTAGVFCKALALGATRDMHQMFPSSTMTFLIPGLSRMGSRKPSRV